MSGVGSWTGRRRWVIGLTVASLVLFSFGILGQYISLIVTEVRGDDLGREHQPKERAGAQTREREFTTQDLKLDLLTLKNHLARGWAIGPGNDRNKR